MDDPGEQLSKSLGPEYISFVNNHAYLEGHKAITLANEVFKFDGWSSEIRELHTDYVDSHNNRHSVGVHCLVRIILKSGVFREDVGYGSSTNMPQKNAAFDKAHKEAVTDGLKRAFRQFGEAMGNCLYNKEYVRMVRSMSYEPPKVDPDFLIRPRKRQRAEPPTAESTSANLPATSANLPTKPDEAKTRPKYAIGLDSDDELDSSQSSNPKPPKITSTPQPVFMSAADIETGSQQEFDISKSVLKTSLPDKSFKVQKKND